MDNNKLIFSKCGNKVAFFDNNSKAGTVLCGYCFDAYIQFSDDAKLSVENVKNLMPILQYFVKNGVFPSEDDMDDDTPSCPF
jgi:hypothetical protein